MSGKSESPAKENNPPPPAQYLLHSVVYGRVEGVGFRQSAAEKAGALGISGTVRNLPDRSSVEVYAHGSRADLDTLLDHLKRGPLCSHVLRVDVDWGPLGKLRPGFLVLPG